MVVKRLSDRLASVLQERGRGHGEGTGVTDANQHSPFMMLPVKNEDVRGRVLKSYWSLQ